MGRGTGGGGGEGAAGAAEAWLCQPGVGWDETAGVFFALAHFQSAISWAAEDLEGRRAWDRGWTGSG